MFLLKNVSTQKNTNRLRPTKAPKNKYAAGDAKKVLNSLLATESRLLTAVVIETLLLYLPLQIPSPAFSFPALLTRYLPLLRPESALVKESPPFELQPLSWLSHRFEPAPLF